MDDHSQDDTVSIATSLNIPNLRILHLSNYNLDRFNNAFKKAAQYYAVTESKHSVILQTDADCNCSKFWIGDMCAHFTDADIVTGPINIYGNKSIPSLWQRFENIGTMVITHAGIKLKLWYSANAANMGYRKEVYEQYVKSSESTHASGDDIFLINWGAKNNFKVVYNKSARSIVQTESLKEMTALFNQRLRWATKTKSYESNRLKSLMSILFIFHFLIFSVLILALIYGGNYIFLLTILLGAKWAGDTFLLSRSAIFFENKYPLIWSPFFSLIHTLYVALMGFGGLFLNEYKWKGRIVK